MIIWNKFYNSVTVQLTNVDLPTIAFRFDILLSRQYRHKNWKSLKFLDSLNQWWPSPSSHASQHIRIILNTSMTSGKELKMP